MARGIDSMGGERGVSGEIWINEERVGTAPMPYLSPLGLWLADRRRHWWSWELPSMRVPIDSRRFAAALNGSGSDDIVLVVENAARGSLDRFSGVVAADEGSYSHPIVQATLRLRRQPGTLRFDLSGRTDVVERGTCRQPYVFSPESLGVILFDAWFELPAQRLSDWIRCPLMLQALNRYVDRVTAA